MKVRCTDSIGCSVTKGKVYEARETNNSSYITILNNFGNELNYHVRYFVDADLPLPVVQQQKYVVFYGKSYYVPLWTNYLHLHGSDLYALEYKPSTYGFVPIHHEGSVSLIGKFEIENTVKI